MPRRSSLFAAVLGLWPVLGAAQATGPLSDVVSQLFVATATDQPASVLQPLRAELDRLLSEDPTGPAATALFEQGFLMTEDGAAYAFSVMEPDGIEASLDQEPLLAMDRALLVAEAIGVPFQKGARAGSCVAALAFELEFRSPETPLEEDLVAARRALIRMARLNLAILTRFQKAVLAGEIAEDGVDFTEQDLESLVFEALVLNGAEAVKDMGEPGYFFHISTGREYPVEEVAAQLAKLTAADWALIEAAQPMMSRVRQAHEDGVSDPREVFCP